MGGGSITRRSRSPKPQERAAAGCWRMRRVYMTEDDWVAEVEEDGKGQDLDVARSGKEGVDRDGGMGGGSWGWSSWDSPNVDGGDGC